MIKSQRWLFVIAMAVVLSIAGCSDDNGTDPDYEGNNYEINANFETGTTRDPDSLYVEVHRLNPDADSPDEASIIIGGVVFELISYDPATDIAIYATGDLNLNPSGDYSFSFACGADSSGGNFVVPPPIDISLTSPVVAAGDTTYPVFTENNPIPVSWRCDGGEPPYVELYFNAVNMPIVVDYRVNLPGDQTSYTIPDTISDGAGGGTFPPATIVVKVKQMVNLTESNIEANIEIYGDFDISMITLLEVDPGGDHTTPVISNIGTPTNPIFTWTPAYPASGFTVYRNTSNNGQAYTGAIWGAFTDGTTEGIYPSVVYGTAPEATYSAPPEENIISGDEYSIMVTYIFEDETGAVAFFSWAP